MTDKKKRPEDYPSFIFRISEEDKETLKKDIEAALNAVKRAKSKAIFYIIEMMSSLKR